jgi:threonine dehydrogenase-like Zn-dependent dehydrogenase
MLGILAAKQLGAERIIAMSRHESRQKLAQEFDATDIVTERGDDGVARVKDLTSGLGAHSVIEAVGIQESSRCVRRISSVSAASRMRWRVSAEIGWFGVPLRT